MVELIAAYMTHAQSYYRKNGAPTTEVESIKVSLRPLRKLYGLTPARDFGPLKLKAVRKALIDSGPRFACITIVPTFGNGARGTFTTVNSALPQGGSS